MSILIHNERIKAAATLLNSAANACFAVGIAAPVVASYLSEIFSVAVLAGIIVWLIALAA